MESPGSNPDSGIPQKCKGTEDREGKSVSGVSICSSNNVSLFFHKRRGVMQSTCP